MFIVVIFSVNGRVTDLNEAFGKIRNKLVSYGTLHLIAKYRTIPYFMGLYWQPWCYGCGFAD